MDETSDVDVEGLISEEVLREAVTAVMSSARAGIENCGFASRMADLGMDSLALAELIVRLEDATGSFLELRPVVRLDTLGDLCAALHRAGTWQ
ncbi:acyl carrier protein [Kitasatospora terrestris]|uniref:Carrier domain-containing protein n=1 Tax=Kitasatospora terrestris TaxID=258051 RepID=A0ABP9DBE7_9ACTN